MNHPKNIEELRVDVGHTIFAARTHKGWTQEQLAKALGTKQPSIARAENGGVLPSYQFLLKVAQVLGGALVPPEIIFKQKKS